MTTIKNHRQLKEFIQKQRLIARKDDVLTDLTRTPVTINGVDISEIKKAGGEGREKFELVCDTLFNKITLDNDKESYYRDFLSLYLHQYAIYHRGVKLIESQLDKHSYSIIKPDYKVNIYFEDGNLYIEDEFHIKEMMIHTDPPSDVLTIKRSENGSDLISGTTKFKILLPKDKTWDPQLVLLNSKLICTDSGLKNILDERTFTQKFIDIIKAILHLSTSSIIARCAFF
ncbi:MAG: hypothetical protein REH83_02095 [Rickettsiella sp.]|nr:hypothetical protein [Rickettsiella sp.]